LKSVPFKDFARKSWLEMEVATSPVELKKKICKLQSLIKEWTRDRIGNVKEQVLICRNFMDWIGKVQEVRRITQLEKWMHLILKRRYAELSILEEDIWRQRPKVKWEINGDQNTRYFYSLATSSKRTN
jgi:hypothetical protein